MQSFELLTRKQIATGLAVAIGTLGIAGCTDYRETSGQGMHLEEDGKLFVPGDSAGKFSTLSCDGTVLVHKEERDFKLDQTYKYVNEPACADGKLTPDDFELSTAPQQ